MRIVAGDLKSRPIRAPENDKTRPTSDKVRGAIFNALASLLAKQDQEWDRFEGVLDLYAGSGALAFEAISRGIPRAVCVEADRDAEKVIRENAHTLGILDRVQTVPVRVGKYFEARASAGKNASRPWLVFADPPYAETNYDNLLALIDASGSIPAGSLVVVEHSARNGPQADRKWNRLAAVSDHGWGDTRATVYEVRPPSEGSPA